MDWRTLLRTWAGGIFIIILSACSGGGAEPQALTGGGPALTQTSYDVDIPSFDGTRIAATVFVPNAPANTPVPLVVHSHSWGAHRLHSLVPKSFLDKAYYMPTEAAAKTANDNGYFVISYDQRGWGQSGGVAQMMSPEYEGRDFQAVVDWAEQHLAPQLAQRNGRTVVATIGYSYGGGFQLLGASLDDRVAVMVPALTWHSFVHGLGPGLPDPQPRSYWGKFLVFSARLFGAKVNPIVLPDITTAADTGVAPQELVDLFGSNGPNAYCDAGGTPAAGQAVPKIPTLLVQGFHDTLLPVNEAVANAACLRAAGADVRLLLQQYGHTLPGLQKIPKGDGIVGIAMQSQITCGSETFALADAMYSFIDENIRGASGSGPHVDVPANCMTLDETHGVVVDAIPGGNTSFTIAPQTVSDSSFIALHTATADEVVAGIPHLNISIGGNNPYAYLGIGVRRAGESTATLLDDQQFPIHGSGEFEADMPGIATSLNAGDSIGILAATGSPQFSYDTAESKAPPSYTIQGTIALPFVP